MSYDSPPGYIRRTEIPMATETFTRRTIYMTFRGYCMHCGNPVEMPHGDDDCNMEGAKLRLDLMGMAFTEWLKVERAERVIKAARQFMDWADDENRQELKDAIDWFKKGPSDG